jgi:uncharacterized protein YgbK (DUF1537 family)
MSARLPDGPLLAYYGDDFTGSTDIMEVMALQAGLPTVLFLAPPTPARLAQFSNRRGIGIAGISRSKPPAWMKANLPPIFGTLFGIGAPLTQYKVCSTFDSSAEIGSIGAAIDIALPQAAEPWSPMVVGAPQLRRWQAFGNLFAGIGSVRYRLDRHPTMSRHPITPMRESDLQHHLEEQTRRKIALIDLTDLTSGSGSTRLQAAQNDGAEIIQFDVVDSATQAEVGRLIWEGRGSGLFSASSSGLQYALVAYWRTAGLLPDSPPVLPALQPVERLLVVSGSCSPETANQIRCADDAGFFVFQFNGPRIADPAQREAEIDMATEALDGALSRGRDVLVYTAASHDDPAIQDLAAFCRRHGFGFEQTQEALGDALGRVAATLIEKHALPRLIVAGGDTSGRVLARLPIDALEAVAPLAPGSPLCRAYSKVPAFEGLELALKGGQVGSPDFFIKATGRLNE